MIDLVLIVMMVRFNCWREHMIQENWSVSVFVFVRNQEKSEKVALFMLLHFSFLLISDENGSQLNFSLGRFMTAQSAS